MVEIRFNTREIRKSSRLSQTEEEISVEIDKQPYFLQRAGIFDLNRAFNQLPQKIKESCGIFPQHSGYAVQTTVFEICEGLRDRGIEIAFRQSSEPYDGDYLSHYLYPIVKGGFFNQISETKLFAREYGVHQLGLNRYYPVLNPQNRGEHADYLTVNAVRTFQALADKDRPALVTRLRRDCALELPWLVGLSDDEMLDRACDHLVVVTKCHDLATPAGGDTIKYLTGIDEEKRLRDLLSTDSPSFAEEREEFLNLLKSRGIEEAEIEFILKCVKGESASLIGDMIHPIKVPGEEKKIDFDQISYTLLDIVAMGILGMELPQCTLPPLSQPIETILEEGLNLAIDDLTADVIAVLGSNIPQRIPTNLINCAEDWILHGEELSLVCTRPDKLAWIAALRVWMIGEHYAGPKMLGLEWELQKRLGELQSEGRMGDILDPKNLLSQTDTQFFKKLSELGDPELDSILRRRNSIGGTTQFRGTLVDSSAEIDESKHFKVFKVNVKPGYGTLVMDRGKVITLGEFVQSHQELVSCQRLKEGVARFTDKLLIIDRVQERQAA